MELPRERMGIVVVEWKERDSSMTIAGNVLKIKGRKVKRG